MEHLKTLVLNTSMMPLRIADWQTSIVLAWQKKVDILEEYDAIIASPSVKIQLPAVVRLHKEVHRNKRGIKFSRQNIFSRDSYCCAYCGDRKSPKDLNYDHVIPRRLGGLTTWSNIVSCCIPCNRKKGGRTPEQAGMKLLFKPHRPTTLPMTLPFLMEASKIPDLWKPYLESFEKQMRRHTG